jgi:hypothetical protein
VQPIVLCDQVIADAPGSVRVREVHRDPARRHGQATDKLLQRRFISVDEHELTAGLTRESQRRFLSDSAPRAGNQSHERIRQLRSVTRRRNPVSEWTHDVLL